MKICRGTISQGTRLETRTGLGGSHNIQMGEALNELPAWGWWELEAREQPGGWSAVIPQREGPGGFTPNFALPTLRATVVDASDSQKKSDCQILWKRELAESGLACSSQKAQSCTIWRNRCWDILCSSYPPHRYPKLPWQVKSSNRTIKAASGLT